jgi:UDP-glucose 4,6-dehydratase
MSDIQLFKVFMSNESQELTTKTLCSGMITQSKRVDEFEEMLKVYFDHPWVLTLNSATAGLTLAYKLLDMKPSDKVMSTPLSCFATNAPIIMNGLDIVWIDTDPNTCNINIDDVKNKLSEDIKALSIVHWGGNPIDPKDISDLKDYAFNKFGTILHVIEDCAHAFGANIYGKKVGTYGNISVFSLQAIKHLTTGDGGLILLPNKEMYERAKLLRWYGISREQRSLPGKDFRLEPDIAEVGYKFHMNDINASIGIGNLPHINSLLQRCRENGQYYNAKLRNISSIQLFNTCNHESPSYWIYTLKVLDGHKDSFMNFMKDKGVVVSQVHARNDTNSCMAKYKIKLPLLDSLEKQIVSIPVGWWVTDENREYIVQCIEQFSKKVNSIEISTIGQDDIESYVDLIFQLNRYKCKTFDFQSLRGKNNIYLLKVDGKAVSTAKLLVEEKIYEPLGHIEDVVTHNDYRGHKYGSKLVKYLLNKALNDFGCYKVTLCCKDDLIPFYESCGLTQTGVSFSKYKNDSSK